MFVLSEEGQAEAPSPSPQAAQCLPLPLLHLPGLPASSASKRRLGFTCLASQQSSQV